MFILAIVLFALAAVVGLAMALAHVRGQTPPRAVSAVLHGLFAASGLVILLIAVATAGTGGGAGLALGLFLLAALGGFTLLSFHLRGRPLPGGLIAGHGLLAVAAFVVLLAAVFVIRP